MTVPSLRPEAIVPAQLVMKVFLRSSKSFRILTVTFLLVLYDETIDFDLTQLFSGGINPDNLPRTILDGDCTPVFPHARLRVNTIFEAVHDQGLETAFADKHPAYDVARGPSGTGLSTGYFPEIAAVPVTVNATIAYDQLHVNAFLDWVDAKVPVNSTGSLTTVPALFGGNFQAGMFVYFLRLISAVSHILLSVSVAQKTVGYENKTLDFTPELLRAIDFVDDSIGQVISKLTEKNLIEDTLIIVASKHGQAPIDITKYGTVDPDAVTNATKVDVLFQTVSRNQFLCRC
jgi:hypothetical protein